MIEVLPDVIIPECVFTPDAGGARTRLNDRSMNSGGWATANAVRDITLRTYDLAVKTMTLEAFQAIIGLWEVTDAGVYGMLLRDPVDSQVLDTEGVMQGTTLGAFNGTLGFGNGTPNYVLAKGYSPSGTTRMKGNPITWLDGTPQLFRAGSPVTIGVSAGNASISAGPSSVTFVADATRTVSSVTPGVTTSVALNSTIGLSIGDYLWLQGLSGADADLLNNQAHEITNIVGAVYTLDTNTSGATITVGSGAAHSYPQPDESLYWAGNYFVPVQFATDDLSWTLMLGGDYEDRLIASPGVSLIEVRQA